MRLVQSIASAGVLILLTSALVGAQGITAPPPAASPPASTSSAPPPEAPMKSLDKRFLLSHASSVYQAPDTTSTVIAHVKRHTHVHVTGMTGNWLQIKLSSGKIGFIPSKAVE